MFEHTSGNAITLESVHDGNTVGRPSLILSPRQDTWCSDKGLGLSWAKTVDDARFGCEQFAKSSAAERGGRRLGDPLMPATPPIPPRPPTSFGFCFHEMYFDSTLS